MNRLFHLILAASIATLIAFCSDPDTQEDVRTSYVEIVPHTMEVDVSDYPFIKTEMNNILMNGDDWTVLRDKLASSNSSLFSVVHIGDSHIQADVSTDRIRNHFQENFGSGGRGLVTPLKIAGTNEPFNYSFTTDTRNVSAKLMKQPWMTDIGFTGVAFTPHTLKYGIMLSTEVPRTPDGTEFNRVRLFASGKVFVDHATQSSGEPVKFDVMRTDDYTDIVFERPVTSVRMGMHSFEPVTIYGAELAGAETGVRYHAIGNNGATYSSYNRLGSMGRDISMLQPDLVIVSLGTNEAFGKVDDDLFYAEIDYLVKDIKKNNPGVRILLTTPMECQKSTRTSRRVRTRNGKRRTVYSSKKNYSVNTDVKRLRDVILDYGVRNGIAVYDWYEVAGGDGASAKWLDSGLMNNDRIHDTFTGYELTGDLMYDAILKTISTNQKEITK